MEIPWLINSLGVLLVVSTYSIVLGLIAVKNDVEDRFNVEANATKLDWSKRNESTRLQQFKYKWKWRMHIFILLYEFFLLSSFGFIPSVPWGQVMPWYSDALQYVSLVPEGRTLTILFWVCSLFELVYIVIYLCSYLDQRKKTKKWRSSKVGPSKTYIDAKNSFTEDTKIPIPAAVGDLRRKPRSMSRALLDKVVTRNIVRKKLRVRQKKEQSKFWRYLTVFGGQMLLEVMFIPSMRLGLETFACDYLPSGETGAEGEVWPHLNRNPMEKCWTKNHLLQVAVSTVLILSLLPSALYYAFEKNEFDPDFKYLPKFNVSIISLKLLLVAFATFSVGSAWPSIIFAFLALGFLTFFNIYSQPCLGEGAKLNHPRSAFFCGAAWAAFLGIIVLAVYGGDDSSSQEGTSSNIVFALVYFLGLMACLIGGYSLSKYQERKLRRQFVKSLVSLSETSSIHEQKKVVINIAKLSMGKKRNDILDHGGLAPVIDLCKSTDSQVQKFAVGCIANLTFISSNIDVCVKAGLAQVLIQAAKMNSCTLLCQQDCVRILVNICNSKENSVLLVESGVLLFLNEIIEVQGDSYLEEKENNSSFLLHENCLRLLRNIAIGSDQNKLEIIKSGTVKILAKVTRSKCVHLRNMAMNINTLLISCKEQRIEIISTIGFLDAFMEVLADESSDNNSHFTTWLCAIGNLVSTSAVRGCYRKREAVADAAMPLLTRLASHENTQINETASKVLLHLMKAVPNYNADHKKSESSDNLVTSVDSIEDPELSKSLDFNLTKSLDSVANKRKSVRIPKSESAKSSRRSKALSSVDGSTVKVRRRSSSCAFSSVDDESNVPAFLRTSSKDIPLEKSKTPIPAPPKRDFSKNPLLVNTAKSSRIQFLEKRSMTGRIEPKRQKNVMTRSISQEKLGSGESKGDMELRNKQKISPSIPEDHMKETSVTREEVSPDSKSRSIPRKNSDKSIPRKNSDKSIPRKNFDKSIPQKKSSPKNVEKERNDDEVSPGKVKVDRSSMKPPRAPKKDKTGLATKAKSGKDLISCKDVEKEGNNDKVSPAKRK